MLAWLWAEIVGVNAFWRMKGQSARRNALIRASTVLVVIAISAIGLTVWDLRQIVLSDALWNADNLAIVLGQQTSRSFQAVDIVMREIQDRVVASGVSSASQFRDEMSTRPMHEFLSSRADRVPQIDSLILIGADGRRVGNSISWPVKPDNLSDHDFVRHFMSGDDSDLFIGSPFISRVRGVWSIYLARRLKGPRGEYLGVVAAGIPLSAIREAYKSINLPQGQSIVLIRRDGIVLARNLDEGDRQLTRMPPGGGWYPLVAQGGGHYESPGVFDHTTRVVVVRALADYPLVVDVGFTKDTVLARWRQEAAIIGIGTAVAAGCLLLLLRALRRQFTRLSASEERLNTTLESMDQGLLMVDSERRVAVCNRRAFEILDMPRGSVDARPTLDELPSLHWVEESVRLAGLTSDNPGRFHSREREMPNGAIVEFGCAPLVGGSGWVATCHDITARRSAERQVAFMARHDALTHLPNRCVFRERIEQAIAQTGRSLSAAVLCLDLDHFKAVNDTLGHPVGDKLLCAVGDRLTACVREVDSVARFGGDEFGVVQVGPERIEDVAVLAQRIIDALGVPYDIDGQQVIVGASIGVALVPMDGSDPDTLLKNADIALYKAKADGRGAFCLFKPEMDAILKRRRALEIDLRRALVDNEFELFYQPQVDAGTHRICGFEALMRWHHPSRGLLEPAAFIELCEETGIIVPLGCWALQQACRDAMRWPADLRVAVNLSAVQFGSRDLVRQVAEALEETGLDPHRLELEITETVLLEHTERVLWILHELRRLGTSISMDDFGTGYSSLSYLRRFPFNRIKIDKSFVSDLSEDVDAAAIVGAVARLGGALGMVTTAEGVETNDQLLRVQAAGYTEVQGYLFGKPIPVNELPQLLRQFHSADQSAA